MAVGAGSVDSILNSENMSIRALQITQFEFAYSDHLRDALLFLKLILYAVPGFRKHHLGNSFAPRYFFPGCL